MINQIRKSTLKVLKYSEDVRINRDALLKLADTWVRDEIRIPEWPEKYHLETENTRRMLDYIIILDSLNFCFWSKDPVKKWRIKYEGVRYEGYFGLSLALKKFFKECPEKANFDYLMNIPYQEFNNILKGEGELLFLKKRWEIVKGVSKVIVEKYNGNSERFLLSGKHKMSLFIPKVVKELPCFNDEARYRNQRVYFWKRAQILACDIYTTLNNKGIGYFDDLEYLTAFADYRLPQILQFWGILEYSPKLIKKIKNRELIAPGSQMEVEIRAATIWTVEDLRDAMVSLGRNVYAYEIDLLLWNESKRNQTDLPHHLTKTISY